MKYQIYFRISRGGTGIPYELAKTEFLAVFDSHGLDIEREHQARRRMWIDLHLTPEEVATLASDLGYTEVILHLYTEPYCGEILSPTEKGRWYTGWIRQQQWKVHQTETYVQDMKSILADSPDRRRFQIERDGKKGYATGHHPQRALSPLDARFLFNVVKLPAKARILDPFAGFGGIVLEAKRRRLTIFASDIDARLSPGLAQLAPCRHFVADARSLPLRTGHFDAIVTEPPFRTRHRRAVMEALKELCRVLRPTGQMVLLVAADMSADFEFFFRSLGGCTRRVQTIPRDGGLKCPVLAVSFPT